MASFQIHTDQENRVNVLKENPKLNVPQQHKRLVLGSINNNLVKNQVKKSKQASKSGKNEIFNKKPNEENVPIKQKATTSVLQNDIFEIHGDTSTVESKVPLKESVVTAQPRESKLPEPVAKLHLGPLQTIPFARPEEFSDEECSPMAIDKSDGSITIQHSKRTARETLDVTEYQDEIFAYLRQSENRHRPKPGYMRKQQDISHVMRAILVDWLVEVGEEYRLQTETLYLAVSYIDRFLSYMSVMRAKLQLVGTAAMFIAAKYEEIYPPEMAEFVYITDDTYTKKQVLRMEHLILKVLSFDMSVPTTLSFLTVFCLREAIPDQTLYFAMYLSELALLEVDPYLEFLPSVKAASCISLAMYHLGEDDREATVSRASGYCLAELEACMRHLEKTFAGAASCAQQAIQDKYKTPRWHNVAMLVPRSPGMFESA